MNRLLTLLLTLRRDQRGAISIVYMLSLPLILLMLLSSVDFIRYSMAQSKLQNALDAAVISAGRRLDTYNPNVKDQKTLWEKDASSYFHNNMPDDFLGGSITSLAIHYGEEKNDLQAVTGQLVQMDVSGTLPLLITGLNQRTAFDLYAKNEAVRRTRSDLEVILALDNSGSMDFDFPKRMNVLKDSATTLVNTLFKAANATDEFAKSQIDIGLVPFTDVVNVGNIPSAKQWLKTSQYPDGLRNYLNYNWSGCIAEPAGNWSSANKLPAKALTPGAGFQPMLFTFSTDYRPSKLPNGAKLLTLNPGFYAVNGGNDRRIAADRSQNANDRFRINLAMEPEYCLNSKVQFLNNSQSNINNAISSMQPYGGTGVPVGLLWAWRMLDPNWRGTTGWGDTTMPKDPKPGRLQKVIVLLTDGENAPVVKRNRSPENKTAQFRLKYDYVECKSWDNYWGGSRKCTGWRDNVQTVDNELDELSLIPANSYYDYQQRRWIYPDRVYNNGSYIGYVERSQCPIDALKMHNPLEITPDNYNMDCRYFNTDIGYHTQYYNNDGYDNSSSRGLLSSSAYDNYMTTLCQNVKSDGNNIRIFTIALSQDVGQNGINLLRNCASSPNDFFNTKNVNNLPVVFSSIAGSLTELRLDK